MFCFALLFCFVLIRFVSYFLGRSLSLCIPHACSCIIICFFRCWIQRGGNVGGEGGGAAWFPNNLSFQTLTERWKEFQTFDFTFFFLLLSLTLLLLLLFASFASNRFWTNVQELRAAIIAVQGLLNFLWIFHLLCPLRVPTQTRQSFLLYSIILTHAYTTYNHNRRAERVHSVYVNYAHAQSITLENGMQNLPTFRIRRIMLPIHQKIFW